ncbi:MAG: hypothetical protein ACFCBW_05845 [Candidatus Competibacterales bacterium]
MTRFLLLLIIASPLLYWLWLRWAAQVGPGVARRRGRQLLLLVGGLLVLGLLVVVSIRFGAAALVLLSAAAPILWRLRALQPLVFPLMRWLAPQLWRHLKNRAARAGGPGIPGNDNDQGPEDDRSQVTTRYLRMTLDHATDQLSGVVIDGPHQGRTLATLSTAELYDLWQLCQDDASSVSVLEAYLERHHPDWPQAFSALGRGSAEDGAGDSDPHSAKGQAFDDMSRDEALEILGLSADATVEAIKQAHRRLIQRIHPDHGGSDFLAAKVNAARDRLLEEA